MREFKKYLFLFLLGGVGYSTIELLWRARTHYSMIIAGGLSFVLFSVVAKRLSGVPLIFKAILCSLGVTVIELLFGLVFNVALGEAVWDYSLEPYNFMGQICPRFTLMWAGLGFLFIPLADLLNKKLDLLIS